MKNWMPERFWKIHAQIFRDELDKLSSEAREIIINDVDKTTEEYSKFVRWTLEKAEKQLEKECNSEIFSV